MERRILLDWSLTKCALLFSKVKVQLYDATHLLNSALCKESYHWAYCKFLMMLYPREAPKKDINGDLPIHIVTALRELSDEETFLCMDCFTKKSTLMCMKFLNSEMKYCCRDCFKFD